jgi:pimeloyl-ACP methyl ester carboxylesterase
MTVETRIDGIAVLDHGGEGPDVLLLHGANRTALDWETVRPHLTGLRLVAMDLRGHGRSASVCSYEWEDHEGRHLPGELPALMAPLEGYDLFADVRGLRVPVLLAAGARTPGLAHLPQRVRELTGALVRGIGRALAALPDRIGVVRLESARHMVHLDEPARVGELIREFVEASGN